MDFLLKPYSFERFAAAARKAKEFHNFIHHKETAQKHLFIRSDYSLVKIDISEILYIEGLADYLKIHLENGKMLLTRMTMKAIAIKLSTKEFARVHRSFIIPLNRIQAVRNKTIYLQDGREIPIGVSYEKDFLKAFNNS